MKSFKIGRFQLGWRMVDLWAEPHATGAWFNLCQNRQDAQIHLGMSMTDPAEVHGVLLHEVFEMCLDDLGHAYKPKAFCDGASDIYRFFFDHNQFTEVAARSAFFMFTCHDAFLKAHAKVHRKRKQ